MTEAGKGVVDLDLDDDEVRRKLRGLDSHSGQVGRSSGGSFSSGFLSSVGRGLSGLGRVVATAGAAAAAGLGAIGVAAGGYGLKIAADNETAAVSFDLLLGSGEKAQDFLKNLQGFAAKTPFEFPELRDAASRLLAVGTNADDVIPIMETLGDATAAMGTGSEGINRAVTALTQVQQKGKVTGEEMLQLAEAGIPAWDALATVLGTDVAGAQDAVSKGTVDAATLYEALEQKAGPALQRVTGLMDVQAETLSGMLSTLKDTVSQNLGVALQPLADTIKDLLPDITELAGSLATVFGDTAATLGAPLIGAFSALADILEPILSSLGGGVGQLLDGIASGLQAAAPGLEAFGGLFETLGEILGPAAFLLGAVIGEALEQLAPVFDALLDALKPLIPIIGKALLDGLAALEPIWPVLIDAIETLAPLFAELADALAKEFVDLLNELVPILLDNAPAMVDMAKAMTDLLIAVLPIIGPIAKLLGVFVKFEGILFKVVAVGIQALADAIGAIVKFDYAGAWGKVTGAVSGFARMVGEQIPKVITFFRELPGKIVGALSTLVTVLIPKGAELLAGFVTGMVKKLPDLIFFIVTLPITLLAALRQLQDFLVPKGIELLAGFLKGLVRKLPELLTFMVELPGKLLAEIVDVGSKLVSKGAEFLAGFATGMLSKLPDLLTFAGELPGDIVSAIGDLTGKLYSAGRDLIRGLWDGISSMAGWLKDKVTGFLGDTVGKLVPGSPVKEGPLTVFNNGYAGKQLVKMFAGGIDDEAQRARKAMVGAFAMPKIARNVSRQLSAAPLPTGALVQGAGFTHNGDNVFQDSFDMARWEFETNFRMMGAVA